MNTARIKVSTNFTMNEATKSATAIRLGIRNVPTDAEVEKIKVVAINILEPPREHYKRIIIPGSWFRCLLLNRAIGSKDNSQHPLAEAVDFEISGVDNLELAHWMVQNVDFDKLILEYYIHGVPSSGWLHVSYTSATTNRHEALTYSEGRYTSGLPGLPTAATASAPLVA